MVFAGLVNPGLMEQHFNSLSFWIAGNSEVVKVIVSKIGTFPIKQAGVFIKTGLRVDHRTAVKLSKYKKSGKQHMIHLMNYTPEKLARQWKVPVFDRNTSSNDYCIHCHLSFRWSFLILLLLLDAWNHALGMEKTTLLGRKSRQFLLTSWEPKGIPPTPPPRNKSLLRDY